MAKNIQKEIEALQAQMAKLQEQAEQERQENLAKLGEQIDKLPEKFGVESLAAVRALIVQREKGTLGKLAPDANVNRKPRVVLDEATKVALVVRIQKGGPGNQRSEIANEANVSYGTIQNWMTDPEILAKAKALRDASTVPAPVSAPAAS
jgi:DNA-binding protein H-NS